MMSPAQAPCSDEGGALPGECARFVMEWQLQGERDRSDFRRGPKAKIDALDVTVLGSLLHEFRSAGDRFGRQPRQDRHGRVEAGSGIEQ